MSGPLRCDRTVLLLLAALGWGGAAAGQSTPAQPPVAVGLSGGVDFISPVGEPFRSPDALSGAEHWFRRADANGDRRLTLAEFRADSLRFFHQLDTDHDGELGSVEIERYETQVAPEISVLSTGDSPPPSDDGSSQSTAPPYPDRLGAGRYGYIDLPEPIVSMDQNFDRGISEREFDQAAQHRFAALDPNGDGVLTRDELPKLKPADDAGEHKHHHSRRPAG